MDFKEVMIKSLQFSSNSSTFVQCQEPVMNRRNTISEKLAGFVATVRGQLARRGWGRPHLELPRWDRDSEPLGALPSH